MESYRHSCPLCGQHLEYTVDYCGKQVVCPSCARPLTFPAVPPGGKKSPPKLKRAEAKKQSLWEAKFAAIMPFIRALRNFKHWNTVMMCTAPFIIIAGLLIGAAVLKKNAGESPQAGATANVQADPNAWQKMSDLAKADQLVQQSLGPVAQASNALKAAQRDSANYHALYKNHAMSASSSRIMAQKDQVVATAQNTLSQYRQAFETAFQNYQKLGGTVDYRQQLPQ